MNKGNLKLKYLHLIKDMDLINISMIIAIPIILFVGNRNQSKRNNK